MDLGSEEQECILQVGKQTYQNDSQTFFSINIRLEKLELSVCRHSPIERFFSFHWPYIFEGCQDLYWFFLMNKSYEFSSLQILYYRTSK